MWNEGDLKPRQPVTVKAGRDDGAVLSFTAIVRLDTPIDALRAAGLRQPAPAFMASRTCRAIRSGSSNPR